MDLAKNLIKLCEERNLSVSKLARLSGVKQPTIFGWTTGRSVKNLDDLKKVCEVLKVSVHLMLYGTKDPFEHLPDEVLKEIFKGNFQITFHRIKDD